MNRLTFLADAGRMTATGLVLGARCSALGTLVLPDSPGYAPAHRSYDPIFDSDAPAAVAYGPSTHGVATSMDFARAHGEDPFRVFS
ncbi:MAG: hypothetical protein ACYCS7_03525 [Acidimicrobiales bacterium]